MHDHRSDERGPTDDGFEAWLRYNDVPYDSLTDIQKRNGHDTWQAATAHQREVDAGVVHTEPVMFHENCNRDQLVQNAREQFAAAIRATATDGGSDAD